MKGLKFPLQVGPGGRFILVEEDEKLKQNIARIINTSIRERLMEPNMGTVGYKLLFKNITFDKATVIANLCQEAIAQQEPRVIANVTVDKERSRPKEGIVSFRIMYVRKDRRESNVFDLEVGDAN